MITRYYICDSCEHSFEVRQNMNDPLKKKCPQCGKMKLYQDLSGQHAFVYQDPKTLGHQAKRNEQRMGRHLLEEKRAQDEKKQKKPPAKWYNSERKNLKKELKHLDTPEKKNKYILEGK